MIETSHVAKDGAVVAELRAIALGPGIEMTQIDHNLPFGIEPYMGAVHGPRGRALEVDSFGIVAAAMAGTFEFVLAGFPIGGASQVRADGGDDENSFGIADHPDAMILLKFRVHPESEVAGIPDSEFGLRFVEHAREEEAQKHQQVYAERAQHGGHYKTTATRESSAFVGILPIRKNGFEGLDQGRLGRGWHGTFRGRAGRL